MRQNKNLGPRIQFNRNGKDPSLRGSKPHHVASRVALDLQGRLLAPGPAGMG
jgi:hypothetical protein